MLSINEWKKRFSEVLPHIRILNDTRPKGTNADPFILYCDVCGGKFNANRKALQTAYYSRKNGKAKDNWCPICNGGYCSRGINDIATVREDLVKYFYNPIDATKYSIGSHKRVKLKCPDCGKSKFMAVCDLCSKGFSCDYCSDNISFPNKICRNLILQLPVEKFDFEFVDVWTENKRYDCYFRYNNIDYLIEIDGEQHTKDTSWSTRQWQEENDKFKTTLAYNNGYELIRIRAYKSTFDYIKKQILQSKLSELFDLSNINWEEIYNKAITNANLEICNYYTEHTDMMLKDIADHFHISMPTLSSTLNKLSQLGLCNYKKHQKNRTKEVVTCR